MYKIIFYIFGIKTPSRKIYLEIGKEKWSCYNGKM